MIQAWNLRCYNMIYFNVPYLAGKETQYVASSILSRNLKGDGPFTIKCQILLENLIESKTLLTTSCTDALEMAAILLNIGPGDEVIMPSYTFVSTALAFIMRGAKVIFADSEADRPHLDMNKLPALITKKTKAIVPVHYAGEACDMGALLKLVSNTNIHIVEDNAQGIASKYNDKSLGTIGTLGALSFHDSKNIVCGEGGALIINAPEYNRRAEIIREKGTDRASFFRGEINKYEWADLGSSYLPSDVLAAILLAQLENIEFIQKMRLKIYNKYMDNLAILNTCDILLPQSRSYSKGNGHMFYLVCKNLEQRGNFIEFMKKSGIMCVFHYLSLHKSKYFKGMYSGSELVNSDRYSDCLVRLPLYIELTDEEQLYIINKTKEFFGV